QDLQAVVNALWAGGARGIQVMDQRLISTSASTGSGPEGSLTQGVGSQSTLPASRA
ncbi:DUF881 domain-containing protein, partial [Streptomyces sp. NPDC006798]|uniref:DUF881 domain-containing protein n=1 Tax=Streptomyces sp. NPDC006798 TaxID=3155462 RepID=UPI0033F51C0F